MQYTDLKNHLNDVNNTVFQCEEGQRIWVIGDVHGCYAQFMNMIKSSYIGKNDIVILIGDIIDRGPDSVKMLEWAMENVNNGGKYWMLRGNHEQNIIDDFIALSEKYIRKIESKEKAEETSFNLMDLSIYNLNCQYDFCEYMERFKVLKIGGALKYIKWMQTLPLYMRVRMPDGKKYILAHAWFEGKLFDNGSINPRLSDEDIVWKRDINSTNNLCKWDYKPMEDEILIHGHTPIPLIEGHRAELAEPLFREYSINIDGGCFMGKKYGGRLIALCLNDLWAFYSV